MVTVKLKRQVITDKAAWTNYVVKPFMRSTEREAGENADKKPSLKAGIEDICPTKWKKS